MHQAWIISLPATGDICGIAQQYGYLPCFFRAVVMNSGVVFVGLGIIFIRMAIAPQVLPDIAITVSCRVKAINQVANANTAISTNLWSNDQPINRTMGRPLNQPVRQLWVYGQLHLFQRRYK